MRWISSEFAKRTDNQKNLSTLIFTGRPHRPDPARTRRLHALYNPMNNLEGITNVIEGIGKISEKWAEIIGFDNKVMAGAWIPGQSENILRVTDLYKRLKIPLVWLVNCSGAKF